MGTLSAFVLREANRHKEMMVFDWDKAARIIKERGSTNASAGLTGDWENTGGLIMMDGKPVPKKNTSLYLASTWATPKLMVDYDTIDCNRMQSTTPGWGSGTYWPDSALAMLRKSLSDSV
jgi:hypothetical protein